MNLVLTLTRRALARALVSQAIICLVVLTGCGGGSSEPAKQVSVSTVYPARGTSLGGTQIRVDGKNFSAGTQVKLDGVDCQSVTLVSPSSITCVTPAHLAAIVDVRVITADAGQVTASGAYTYRSSGTGVTSFGILAAAPMQGAYTEPFTVKLESVISGFDLTTTTRAWEIDGKTYNERDPVKFDIGSHTVTLTVKDSTGDSHRTTYSVVVGPQAAQSIQSTTGMRSVAAQDVESTFDLNPTKSIALVNTGLFPLLNPRFIGAGKPDYVDWLRYLNSLTQLGGIATDATESGRAALLEAAWRDLSNTTFHVCSPGREDENIYDPALLVRGYGYECCSNSARALAYVGAFLDIPSRVRSTVIHEYPEFTVSGNMFLLDPDLHYRYWGVDGLPLSAWTSQITPVSLMNVEQYVVESAAGAYYQVQAGGSLLYGVDANFSEQSFREFYFNNITGETIWAHRDAFTTPSYVVHPGEKIAFRQDSGYAGLQWLNADGTTTGGNKAPAVGKVLFKMLWSTSGPRSFQKDSSGNLAIPLAGLPFPLQDLVFYFSKPINPQDFWLTASGKTYKIGEFNGNTWTVAANELRALRSVADLTAIIGRDQNLAAVDVGMQFNARIFGDPNGTVNLSYADDSGSCQREFRVTLGADIKDHAPGNMVCDPQAIQRTEKTFTLARGDAGASVISNYGNSYQGVWGVGTLPGVRGSAEITLPRTPGLPGVLRATVEGVLSDWEILDGGSWAPLSTTDMASSQWIQLPATSSATSRLRLTMRDEPADYKTYLSYLSLMEGRSTGNSPVAGGISDTAIQAQASSRKAAQLRSAVAKSR